MFIPCFLCLARHIPALTEARVLSPAFSSLTIHKPYLNEHPVVYARDYQVELYTGGIWEGRGLTRADSDLPGQVLCFGFCSAKGLAIW